MRGKNFIYTSSISIIVLLCSVILYFTTGFGQPKGIIVFALLNVTILAIFTVILYFIFKSKFIRPLKSLNEHIKTVDLKELSVLKQPAADVYQQSLNIFNNIASIISQLKSKIKELRESKDYIETLMKTVQTSIIVFDEKFKPIYINDYGLNKFNLNEQTLKKLSIKDLINQNSINEIIQELNHKNSVVNRQEVLYAYGGGRIEGDISVSKLPNKDNDLMAYILVINDITQSKKAEINLKNQISFTQKIFQAIPDLILITDTNLNILFSNEKAQKTIKKSNIVGQKIVNILSKESIENGFDDFLRNIITSAENLKQINVLNPFTEDPSYVDLVIQPLKSDAKMIGILISTKDVSEWRNLTEKLKNLQEFTEKMINASPFAIISIDKEDKILLWNKNAERIFAISWEQALHKNIYEINANFINFKDTINEVRILDKTITLSEKWIESENEVHIACNLTFYPIYSDGKNIVIHIEDVSEIKKLEDSLSQAHKMESLGLLTSSIIHDFNNVLSGILGYASLLDKVIYADPKLKKYVSYIISSGEKAANMIRQILEFSKKKLSRKEVINLNDMIEESLDFLTMNLKSIHINKELSTTKILLSVDRTKIAQVIINLIINAKEALKRRPKPQITIKSEETYLKEREGLVDGHYATLQIIDNGSGIKKEYLQKIFEPFFTTKEKVKGTGIGLATVKDIIEEFQGAIEVESEYAVGTTFRIYLPIYNEPESQPLQDTNEEIAPALEGMVLLIDDEEVIREIGKDMLQSLGLECITASNGDEGIQLYQQHQNQIKIVILDVEMPGTSGEKVFEILKNIDPEVRILLASGYGKDYLESNVFKERIEYFMPKPFQLKQLSNKLNQMI